MVDHVNIRAADPSPAPRGSLPLLELGLSLLVLVGLVGASIALWSASDRGREATLLALFAVAGATGGSVRSLAYLLAYRSFTFREWTQWRLEAFVAPVCGAVLGLVAYMVVRASLVDNPSNINRSGQYLVSLVAGALALVLVGRIVERGLLRGGLSRSGILGAEVSPSVPLLDRLERMLEQRVADLTTVNYDGYIEVTHKPLPRGWQLSVVFTPEGPDQAVYADSPVFATRLKVAGGETREFVPFTLSVISDDFAAIPLVLSMVAPRDRRSEEGVIVLRSARREFEPGQVVGGEQGLPSEPALSAILEIGQGTQTLQVVPITLRR